MGVVQPLFEEIHRNLLEKTPKNALSLGYPDMLVAPLPGVKVDPNSAKIAEYHGKSGPFMDSVGFFDYFGCRLSVVDYAVLRGPEIIADLNGQAPLGGPYDLLLDPGTMEHIFNLSACLENILVAVHEGSTIIHWNPLNACNHGFYNFSPTFYYDFYEANGGRVVHQAVCFEDKTGWSKAPLYGPITRLGINHPNCWIMTTVEIHTKYMGNLVYPIQSKYKAMLNA